MYNALLPIVKCIVGYGIVKVQRGEGGTFSGVKQSILICYFTLSNTRQFYWSKPKGGGEYINIVLILSSVASPRFSPAMQIFSCSLTVKTINF